jgi:hypothetical protein
MINIVENRHRKSITALTENAFGVIVKVVPRGLRNSKPPKK